MSQLKPVIVDPLEKHTATVIWIHGLGDSGVGWVFFAEELQKDMPYVRWVFPNAPVRELSAEGRGSIPAWFNIYGFDRVSNVKSDIKGMMESVDMINQIIQDEVDRGIPVNRIILGGFSQGCVIALLTAVHTPHQIGGAVACNGWLEDAKNLSKNDRQMNRKIPILVCHGTEDEVVKYKYGELSAIHMKKNGFNVKFNSYPFIHSMEPEMMEDIKHFMIQCLSSNSKL
ncbi:Phospholipase/carboxylesterase/thioesterase [Pilobolus umbonatus]|nr:Phospholipase/carboxylesterase/thioesterase [Pilobolus umbonatus]